MSKLLGRSIRIAEAYLQTAVIVDDQAQLGDAVVPPTTLKTPDRRTVGAMTAAEGEVIAAEIVHNLNVKPLVDAFAEKGIVCGVIAPEPGASIVEMTTRAADRSDIVILDWQINRDEGRTALAIISQLMTKDRGERLRTIAIYTGEKTLTDIGQKIVDALKAIGKTPVEDEWKVILKVGHTRISVYAKSGTDLPAHLKARSVSEAELPRSTIADFASIANGLVPSIALTALAALRTNASRILDKYHAGLDAPYLAHRACLPHPDDASRHIAAAIAAEAGCVMESAVHSVDPASIDFAMDWVNDSFGASPEFVFQPDRKLDCDAIRGLFSVGFDKQKKINSLSNRDSQDMTRVISRDKNADDCLDLELAWVMSFRTVYDGSPPPVMRLGTVVRRRVTEGAQPLFLCLRPRCDCVRLSGVHQFHFLPLIDPPMDKNIQLSVRVAPNTYRRFSVGIKPSEWLLAKFAPAVTGGAVTASRDGAAGICYFATSDGPGTIYDWIGELKPEFAQRIANQFATLMSRVAVNNSEWLRRQENLAD